MALYLSRIVRQRLAVSPIRKLLVAGRNSRLRAEDCMIGSYPKSGNTWLRMLLSSLVAGQVDSFDDLPKYVPTIDKLGHNASPYRLDTGGRMVKTHEQWSWRYRQGVYVVRDCRDVVVSYYRHQLLTGQFKGAFNIFFHKFLRGKVDGYGRWDRHVASWLGAAEQAPEKFLIVRYEDMQKSTERVLGEIATFLGLSTDEMKIAAAVEGNSPKLMQLKEVGAKTVPRSGRSELPFVRTSRIPEFESLLADDHLSSLRNVMGSAAVRLGYKW